MLFLYFIVLIAFYACKIDHMVKQSEPVWPERRIPLWLSCLCTVLVTLPIATNKTLKQPPPLPFLNVESLWWWQCSIRYLSPLPHPPGSPPPLPSPLCKGAVGDRGTGWGGDWSTDYIFHGFYRNSKKKQQQKNMFDSSWILMSRQPHMQYFSSQ